MARQEYRVERLGHDGVTWERVGINRRLLTWDDAKAFAEDMLAYATDVRVVYRGRVVYRSRRRQEVGANG